MAELAAAAVQDETALGPVVFVAQVVAVQLFPAVSAVGVHAEVGVGPVALVVQVVVV